MDEKRLEAILRVDHAGETGALAIYQGQRAVLQGQDAEADQLLARQQAQEERHLAFFQQALGRGQFRPSALLPLWQAGGFALGALTALMGAKAANACTMAVEEVIERHYAGQIEELADEKALDSLRVQLRCFRAEEMAHGAEAKSAGGPDAPGFALLHGGIKQLVAAAIKVAEKL